MLGLTTEYANRFDHFKTRVLDRAQTELSATDLPIAMEFIRRGKAVHTIRFMFAATIKALPAAPPDTDSWQALPLQTGISAKSLDRIQAKLEFGDYPEGYIRYVVAAMEAQVTTGKVKKLAGAVFKALTESYLLPAYEQHQQPKAEVPKSRAAVPSKFTKSDTSVASTSKHLANELVDAHGTLNLVTSAVIYTDETRSNATEQVQATIHRLK